MIQEREGMKVLKILNRVYLENGSLNEAVPFYESVLGEKCHFRFNYRKLGLELGQVGSVLLIAGSSDKLEAVKSIQMTFVVDSINDFRHALLNLGAEIIHDMTDAFAPANLKVRHPDGAMVEYVEPG